MFSKLVQSDKMGSRHSESTTSNGNEGLNGLIEEREGHIGVAKGTKESSLADKLTCCDHRRNSLFKDIFLSHSGQQKNLVRQLHRDLLSRDLSCFFDEDRESLAVGEAFPQRIIEAAEKCRVAVLLLSKEFLEARWPMLELSTFVKARKKNPSLTILPLFFKIEPEDLKEFTADNEKWKKLEKCKAKRDEWREALKLIRGINGLKFIEDGNEVNFRDDIVKEIWRILPTPSQRYHVPCMQGEKRMCQIVADLFNSVQPNQKQIRIAGLYGIAGQGKTMLGKAFCNLKWGDFQGKVCHLELSRGESFERIKHALRYLAQCPLSHLQTLTENEAQVELHTRLKGQRVLLVLDNITKESINEAKDYVQADLGKNSWILLSARSMYILVKHFQIDSQSCKCAPSLEDNEAIGIFLEKTSLEESKLGERERSFALEIVQGTCHRLLLKEFGSYLHHRYGPNMSQWVARRDGLLADNGLDDVFSVLGKAFDELDPKHRTIFMLLTVYMLPNMSPHKVPEWLAINCNQEIKYIQKAVEHLWEQGFIKEFEGKICMHDIYIVFGQRKTKEMGKWLWWEGNQCSTRCLSSEDPAGFELAKLEQCMYRRPSQIATKHLKNLLVLQLVSVKNVSELHLGCMESLRSIMLHDCKDLAVLIGMEGLLYLAWIEIGGVNSRLKIPKLSNLNELRYLEIDISDNEVTDCLGDLTPCFNLREIVVHCPSLLEFPSLNGLPVLEKVEFLLCDKVKGPLDCSDCGELQSIVLDSCCQVSPSPIITGCKKLLKIEFQKHHMQRLGST